MTAKDLNALGRLLVEAKAAEMKTREHREMIEAQIYIAMQELKGIPERGTVSEGAVSLTVNVSESWDQEKLKELQSTLAPEHFPFTTVFKCDGHAKNKLAVDHPAEFRKLYSALTTKPRKPAFKVDEEKLV